MASAKKILRLTGVEYKQMVQAESVPMDSVLIVDRLPLDVDLPMVAGLVVSSPLGIEGTHVHLQAQMMSMPLAFDAGAYEDSAQLLKSFNQKYVQLSTKDSIKWEFADKPFADSTQRRLKSRLPIRADRSQAYIQAAGPSLNSPETLGSKFLSLARFSGPTSKVQIPRIYSSTSGYYEKFLDDAQVDHESLRTFIRRMEARLQTASEEETKSILESVRTYIMSAKADVFFASFYEDFKAATGGGGRWSVRSNNEIEDLLSAGLFQSFVMDGDSRADFELKFKSAWASLFTYRAYRISRYWGVQRANLSMPNLLHRYIDGEILHATGVFKQDTNGLLLEVNLVLGAGGRATNPDQSAPTLQLRIAGPKDAPVVTGDQNQIDKKIVDALLTNYVGLHDTVISDFNLNQVIPQTINIELVVNSNFESILLQYTKRQTRQTILALLSGTLQISDLDRPVTPARRDGLASVIAALNARKVRFLNQTESKVFRWSNMIPVRGALVSVDGKPRLIIFKNIDHDNVRQQLVVVDAGLKWIDGLYFERNKDGVLFIRSNSHRWISQNVLTAALRAELEPASGALETVTRAAVKQNNGQTTEINFRQDLE